ncbi:MAG: hypothetical protein GY711_19055 [bacterium]|nr:hypothetical protein [bacterium]
MKTRFSRPLSFLALSFPALSFLAALSACAFAAHASAQTQHFATGEPEPIASSPNLQVELTQWRSQHGEAWHTHADRTTGHLEMLYGGSATPLFVPTPGVDAEWIELARHFVRETHAMHGIEDGDLTLPRVVFLPLGMGNGSDKITVRLHQQIGGVPVENGAVNVLFNTRGELLSVHSTGAPAVAQAATTPALSAGAAQRVAVERFEDQHGASTHAHTPELVFAQVESEGVRGAHLAWQVEVTSEEAGSQPVGYRYTIDASSGRVLRSDTTVHNFDVTGQVQTMASPGTLPDMATNPPAPLNAGHIRLTSSAGTVFADRDGNFTFPGINTPLDITATYVGNFNQVFNEAGAEYSVTFGGVQPNQPNTLLMNPAPTEFITAQANGYRHVGIVRDYVRDTVPTDSTADFQATSFVNIAQTCNAFFNGNSINFFRAGGGCNNSAFSTVIAHEFGHWLNERYGTGNGSDGMGEGNADTFGLYVYDTPTVGEFFTTGGGGSRSGENTRQFCGDANPGCHGGVHANGEVWMGAAWKVRRNLNNVLGNTLGDATADGMFMGWMNAYNQTQIRSIIEIQWLTLDDNDGDINNGTPNYTPIDAGFQEQGFPGFELAFVQFQNVTQVADTPNEAGPYIVDADMIAQFNPPVVNPELFFSVNDGPFTPIPMAPVAGNTYRAEIPGIASPAIVEYYLSASDSSGNSNVFPDDAPNNTLDFAIGNLTTFLFSEFEGPGSEGWTVGAPGDTATTGVWVRDDPVGTTAQAEDDHTAAPGTDCWFTGQGVPGGATGANDVDGGPTSLLSPIFDASGLTSPTISFWLWYSATSDPFRVQVSNDGGATWNTALTLNSGSGGWQQRSFDLAQAATLTASMQLRFVAADLAGGSIVEAAIDDIEGSDLASSCDAPAEFCPTTPNSVGTGAQISMFGSQNVAQNDLNLFAGGAPAFQFGLFLYGAGQSSFPVGDGTLCVALPFFRLPVVQTDLLGQAVLNVDLTSPPAPAAEILPGSTWNFQFWYRDPAGGPAANNLSNGLSIQFCQ